MSVYSQPKLVLSTLTGLNRSIFPPTSKCYKVLILAIAFDQILSKELISS